MVSIEQLSNLCCIHSETLIEYIEMCDEKYGKGVVKHLILLRENMLDITARIIVTKYIEKYSKIYFVCGNCSGNLMVEFFHDSSQNNEYVCIDCNTRFMRVCDLNWLKLLNELDK